MNAALQCHAQLICACLLCYSVAFTVCAITITVTVTAANTIALEVAVHLARVITVHHACGRPAQGRTQPGRRAGVVPRGCARKWAAVSVGSSVVCSVGYSASYYSYLVIYVLLEDCSTVCVRGMFVSVEIENAHNLSNYFVQMFFFVESTFFWLSNKRAFK